MAEAVVDGEMTVDELAARTGMTVRTLRFYASEGLLPPPQRRGRVAYYDARHRMRLDLVRTLQKHGYTLSAIQRVLARIPEDASPDEYAVQSAVLAPWLPEQTEELDRAGLERRAGRRITDGQIDDLVSLGALERRPSGRFLASPVILGHAVELMELPVPPAVLRESATIIEQHATAVANGLTDLFARAVWGPYQRGEIDHEQLMAILQRMRPLALQGLLGAFARAADAAAHRRLES
ncbi:MAG TPA: MerR family transcriptional regulator [Jatrophihabitans sp.]|nr:MerR family transcriptional regulator [Jatrophihabitans sp.]